MSSVFSRTELLLGNDALTRLSKAHVLVVGLGGVGGYAAEMLCRAGVGRLTIVDGDTVSESNINRQIIATVDAIGQSKAMVMNNRLKNINPNCEINAIDTFLRDDEMIDLLKSVSFDYVVDAIDTLAPKVFLIYHSYTMGLPIVSSMGSAGKLDPSKIELCDISKSHTCPLAAMVRKRLHKLGVREGVKVVFSSEKVIEQSVVEERSQNKRTTIGTISYLPPLFGCYCASAVIRDIISNCCEL